MTAKRFTFMQDTLVKADVFDNEEFVCCTLSVWVEQLVDLLNEQHETIQRLKQNINELLSINVEEELLKENEQLKQEIKDIEKVKDGFYDKVFSLINQFIEYNQLKVGNHDDVVDNLRELRKELKGDVE